MSQVKTVDFVVIKDGKTLTLEAADGVAAEMLISAYVPDAEDLGLDFVDAYKLALERDKAAAEVLMEDCEAAIASGDLTVGL